MVLGTNCYYYGGHDILIQEQPKLPLLFQLVFYFVKPYILDRNQLYVLNVLS